MKLNDIRFVRTSVDSKFHYLKPIAEVTVQTSSVITGQQIDAGLHVYHPEQTAGEIMLTADTILTSLLEVLIQMGYGGEDWMYHALKAMDDLREELE